MKHHPSLGILKINTHKVYTVAIIGFIYTISLVLPTYSNSSFLSLFASPNIVGIIYMIGAAVTALGFLFVPYLLRMMGNYTLALWTVVLDMFFLYGLIHSSSTVLIVLFFVLHTATIALVGISLDVFLEVYSEHGNEGKVRGLYLTTLNTAWIITPIIGTMIIDGADDFRGVYTASLYVLLPLLYLIYKNFPKFKDPKYNHISIWHTLQHVEKNKDSRNLFFVNIILQTFYAWMVVYSPIYLHNVIGLSWFEIGIVITIMLLPFPILEWPLGKLADKKYGEKEMMIAGFIIMGLATVCMSLITSHSVWIWSLILFLTRVGAATAEIMIETYFFKTVTPDDTSMLGVFRTTRPISYFIAPFITSLGLVLGFSQQSSFVLVGIMCLFAVIPSISIRDTN
jgi:MFS family permease